MPPKRLDSVAEGAVDSMEEGAVLRRMEEASPPSMPVPAKGGEDDEDGGT